MQRRGDITFETYDDYQDVIPVIEHGMSLSPCVLKPLSRGKVALRNASPSSKPAIVHNYYTEPEDRRNMIEGARVGPEIAAQPAMRTHITQPYRVPKSESEADIWEYVQRYTQTIFHPTSTCAIGPVVDNELRVQGFEGLRVVDASVMPSIVRGNTNAPTIMIAERAADLIREREPV
jgi:choline dehydrogenase-like flavoprotein